MWIYAPYSVAKKNGHNRAWSILIKPLDSGGINGKYNSDLKSSKSYPGLHSYFAGTATGFVSYYITPRWNKKEYIKNRGPEPLEASIK